MFTHSNKNLLRLQKKILYCFTQQIFYSVKNLKFIHNYYTMQNLIEYKSYNSLEFLMKT